MVVWNVVIDFASSHRAATALFVSVVGGAVFTFAWANISHLILIKTYRMEFTGKDRSPWVAGYIGMVERLLVTMLALWAPQALGAVVSALLVLKAIMGWGDLQTNQNKRTARTRYSVALMNSVVSMIWAIGWGIWGATPH